jgi:hypothetical protein
LIIAVGVYNLTEGNLHLQQNSRIEDLIISAGMAMTGESFWIEEAPVDFESWQGWIAEESSN